MCKQHSSWTIQDTKQKEEIKRLGERKLKRGDFPERGEGFVIAEPSEYQDALDRSPLASFMKKKRKLLTPEVIFLIGCGPRFWEFVAFPGGKKKGAWRFFPRLKLCEKSRRARTDIFPISTVLCRSVMEVHSDVDRSHFRPKLKWESEHEGTSEY